MDIANFLLSTRHEAFAAHLKHFMSLDSNHCVLYGQINKVMHKDHLLEFCMLINVDADYRTKKLPKTV